MTMGQGIWISGVSNVLWGHGYMIPCPFASPEHPNLLLLLIHPQEKETKRSSVPRLGLHKMLQHAETAKTALSYGEVHLVSVQTSCLIEHWWHPSPGHEQECSYHHHHYQMVELLFRRAKWPVFSNPYKWGSKLRWTAGCFTKTGYC